MQGQGLEHFHRLGAAEQVESGVIAPMYNHPSGPWTWLAFAGRGGGRAGAGANANADAADGGGGELGATAVKAEAYDWKKDLQA